MDERLVGLQPGTVIAGRFEVVKCLGQGSMGLVYACRNLELSGHMVAMKVLFPEVAEDEVASKRFRNEIYASYGVSHPNVVRAYEYINEDDVVAYTMEFVGGGDLADRLEHEGQLPLDDTVKILFQMCQGVQAIHDAGIIHRDLKPENILLSREEQVKIADFGIARTDYGPRLTDHGGVVGTLDYVSPEYMLNSQVDNRSDIYAMGILAYEMVTGNAPFRGESVYKTMTQRLKTDPPPPSEFRAECDPRLDAIILKAMARNPVERYQSAAEMAEDLLPLLPEGMEVSGSFEVVAEEERSLRDIAGASEKSLESQAFTTVAVGAGAGAGGGSEEVRVPKSPDSETVETTLTGRNSGSFEEVDISSLVADAEKNGGTRGDITAFEEIEIASLYGGQEETHFEPIAVSPKTDAKNGRHSIVANGVNGGSHQGPVVERPLEQQGERVSLAQGEKKVSDSALDSVSPNESVEFINSLKVSKDQNPSSSLVGGKQPERKAKKGIPTETIVLMVGITFGIVVGFFVIKYFFPGLL